MTNHDSSDPVALLRGTQVIVGSLAFGVLTFAAVALFLGPLGQPPAPIAFGLDLVALLALATTLALSAASFLVPARIVESAREAEPARRMQAFRSSRLVGAALCEGPALLWCVALLLSGNRWFVAPIAILVALMAAQIPTRDAFEEATGTRAR